MDKSQGPHKLNRAEANYLLGLILLDPTVLAEERTTRREASQTFWHEAWHHMMNVLGEGDLAENEKLADQFGGLMAQLMATAEWGGPVSKEVG